MDTFGVGSEWWVRVLYGVTVSIGLICFVGFSLEQVRERRSFFNYNLYLNMFSIQKVVKSIHIHVGGTSTPGV